MKASHENNSTLRILVDFLFRAGRADASQSKMNFIFKMTDDILTCHARTVSFRGRPFLSRLVLSNPFFEIVSYDTHAAKTDR